jgi:Recombination, repair and ssDNA binding protein UvsY
VICLKIEEIRELWDQDSIIDKTEIGNESLKIPKLHAKYIRILSDERLLLRKLETDLKVLKRDKYEFYTMGPTKEQKELGWDLPARGMVLKQDINIYMDADKQIIDLTLRIGMQQEKVELLDSIIKSIMNRGYQLKTALDFIKFTFGG